MIAQTTAITTVLVGGPNMAGTRARYLSNRANVSAIMIGDVYDFSFNKPSAQQIVDAGGSGAICYLSYDKTKNWTEPLLTEYRDAGLEIGVVWEASEADVFKGLTVGQQHATDALKQADGLGLDCPIYFACDIDVPDPQTVAGYFDGVRQVFGELPRGAYGGQNVLKHLFDLGYIQYGWATNATSFNHGVIEPRCALQQHYNASPIPGTDRNTVLRADWGQEDDMSDPKVIMLLTDISNKLGALMADEENFGRPSGLASIFQAQKQEIDLLTKIAQNTTKG